MSDDNADKGDGITAKAGAGGAMQDGDVNKTGQAKPSATAPEGARPIDADNPHSSTARPAGHAVNGDTSTTDVADVNALGTGTMLKNK